MKKSKNILIVLVLLLITALVGICAYGFFNQPKIAFVRAEVLFNEFMMTKEMKTSYENVRNSRNNILDSMVLNLRLASQGEKAGDVAAMEKEYLIKKEMFDQQNSELTQKYDDQVWLRINQYVKDYSEHNGYDILLGANGTGSLMYGAKGYDITEEVLKYMNHSYEGGSLK